MGAFSHGKRKEDQNRDLSSAEKGNALHGRVVTVSPEGVTATAVESNDEARILASKKTLKVLVEDSRENSGATGPKAMPSSS